MDNPTSLSAQPLQPPPAQPDPVLPVADASQIDEMIAQLQAAKDAMNIAPSPTVGTKAKENIVATAPTSQVSEQQPNSGEVADKVAKEEGDEYWENYAREIELEKKILEMGGIEKVEKGEVKLPENIAKEMGIKPVVNVDTPIVTATDAFKVSNVSLTDDQMAQGSTKPINSAFRWLIEWFILQLRKARYLVKKVHGKIVRQKV